MKYILENAYVNSLKYPETFFVPSQDELEQIKVGGVVKLCFKEIGTGFGERMWVVVDSITKDNDTLVFTGKLNSYPTNKKIIKYEDIVNFNQDHIYDIC